MEKEVFDAHFNKLKKLEQRINNLQHEYDELKELLNPYFQFHEPLLNIATLKEKYWHCNCTVLIDKKINRHTVYLGAKDKFEGKTDKKLVKLAKNKMTEFLRRKYPKMFE
jgi:hypothetical protein